MATQQSQLEKELKYLLTKQGYAKLISVTRRHVREKIKHTNYYFDDPRLRLRKKKFGLRIRIQNGNKAFITLKEPAAFPTGKVPSLKVRHEWETEIPLKTAKAILAGKKQMADLKIKPIQILKRRFNNASLDKIAVLGSVKTLRTVVVCRNRVELEIDKFKMFNKKFYELEVETEKPAFADRTVRLLLRRHRIPYHPITKSKLGRFIEMWKKGAHA